MHRLPYRLKSAAAVLVIVAVLGVPQRSAAQSPLHGILEKRIETKPLQDLGTTTLKVAFAVLQDMLKANGKGVELPILIDDESFKAEDGSLPDIYETRLTFPPYPSHMTVAAAIRYILDQWAGKNATYVMLPDHILVTTMKKASPQSKLGEKVRAFFDNRPLTAALRELSEMVGATIVVDNRATDKAKTVVSATFLNDIDLAGALRVLTEMADLKVIVLDGAIFVTTPGHVDALRKEYFEKMKQLKPPQKASSPPAGGLGGGYGGLGGGLGGLGGGLGGGLSGPGQVGIPTPADDPILDPFWPYSPQRGPRPPQGPAI